MGSCSFGRMRVKHKTDRRRTSRVLNDIQNIKKPKVSLSLESQSTENLNTTAVENHLKKRQKDSWTLTDSVQFNYLRDTKNYLRQSEVRNIDRARNEYREILKKAKNHSTYYSDQGDGERAIPSKLPKLKIHSTKKLTEKNFPEGNTDLNKLSIL